MYGVTIKDNSVENIIIKVKKPRAYYIKTKPEHSSQEILSEDDTNIRFGYRMIINNEIISYFLSFGKDLAVEAPDSLKKEISEKIMEISSLYD